MPQMSPMNWILLFFMFTLIFLLMNIMNFYNYTPYNSPSQKKMFKLPMYNWKW